MKVGTFSIHEAKFNDMPTSDFQFCVPEEKTVLFGSTRVLTDILERKKGLNLSANMKAGLKVAGFSNAISLVMDVQDLSPDLFPELKGVADNLIKGPRRDGE